MKFVDDDDDDADRASSLERCLLEEGRASIHSFVHTLDEYMY